MQDGGVLCCLRQRRVSWRNFTFLHSSMFSRSGTIPSTSMSSPPFARHCSEMTRGNHTSKDYFVCWWWLSCEKCGMLSETPDVVVWIIFVWASNRTWEHKTTLSVFRMDTQQISDLFMIFNVSGDGSMSKQEFVYCWNGWIKKVFFIPVIITINLKVNSCDNSMGSLWLVSVFYI